MLFDTGFIAIINAPLHYNDIIAKSSLDHFLLQNAYFVGVQIEEGSCNNEDRDGLSAKMRQQSTVGAVRVALRTLSVGAGSSRSE